MTFKLWHLSLLFTHNAAVRTALQMELHMWQSQVEIEHYSVAYFTRIAAFEAL